jgi:hypothetical protein
MTDEGLQGVTTAAQLVHTSENKVEGQSRPDTHTCIDACDDMLLLT